MILKMYLSGFWIRNKDRQKSTGKWVLWTAQRQLCDTIWIYKVTQKFGPGKAVQICFHVPGPPYQIITPSHQQWLVNNALHLSYHGKWLQGQPFLMPGIPQERVCFNLHFSLDDKWPWEAAGSALRTTQSLTRLEKITEVLFFHVPWWFL